MRQSQTYFIAFLLLAFFGQSSCAQEAGPAQAQTTLADITWPISEHLASDARLADILDNPAFAGFAERILPWHGRRYDPAMPLGHIGPLVPYHTVLNVETMVSALNLVIDEANAGQTIFYELYSEAEIRADPSKAAAGLFVFRGRPGAPFAVIAAGGAFSHVASLHEGFPYAQGISEMGFNAFVVTYRTGQGGRVATEDMARAIAWIFDNAVRLEVSTLDYSVWGSSAGARMAAYIGSHGPAAFGADDLPKPAAVIMAYTSHSDLAATEPPTFVVVGEDDRIAPPINMERRIADLRRLGTLVEYHRFPNVGHGFGAGIGTSAEGWIAQAVRFWDAAQK
ncbi:alpha/beta hydrolase [Yoonia maritima]|uniref:alpha/beta hydrolase n=1 Tax=Yoonia maritima TaxID=1435347 RepID=UPI000D10E65A|nr:alpha/beta hydrolase [Yoonia maritima]